MCTSLNIGNTNFHLYFQCFLLLQLPFGYKRKNCVNIPKHINNSFHNCVHFLGYIPLSTHFINLSHCNLFHHQIDSVLAILPQAQYHPLHMYAKFFRNQSILKAFNNLNSNRCLRLDFKNHDQNPMKLLKAANVHFFIFTRPSSVALVNLMTNYSIIVKLGGHRAQHSSQF